MAETDARSRNILHVMSGNVPPSAASVVAGASEAELESARQKLASLLADED